MMMIQMQKTFTPITSGVADSPLTQSLCMIEYDPNGENLYTHYLRWSWFSHWHKESPWWSMAQLILIYFLLVPEVCSSFGSKCLSSALNCMIAKSQLYNKKITMDPIWLMDGFLFFCLSVHKDQVSSTTTHPLDSQASLKSKESSPKLDPRKTPLFHCHWILVQKIYFWESCNKQRHMKKREREKEEVHREEWEIHHQGCHWKSFFFPKTTTATATATTFAAQYKS